MFDANALFDQLSSESLPTSPGDLRFATTEIPGWPGYHIGRTLTDEAALLVETSERKDATAPPVRLQSLAVHHNARCRVVNSAGHVQERDFTVVWYVGGDPIVRRYFLGMFAPTVASLGLYPSASSVSAAVDALAQLFRALGRPSRESTQGLWAELLIIAEAKDAELLVKAWHTDPQERFDFSQGPQRVEVKSATGTRKHHFALEQLCEPVDAQIVIASMLTTRVTGGTSLQALLDRVLRRLVATPLAQEHVIRVVAETLGANLSEGLQEAFDEQLARTSLLCFRASQVPTIPTPIPASVSDVRFVADLSTVEPIPRTELTTAGGLFTACGRLLLSIPRTGERS